MQLQPHGPLGGRDGDRELQGGRGPLLHGDGGLAQLDLDVWGRRYDRQVGRREDRGLAGFGDLDECLVGARRGGT
jgi:hypothetical protein